MEPSSLVMAKERVRVLVAMEELTEMRGELIANRPYGASLDLVGGGGGGGKEERPHVMRNTIQIDMK